MYMLYQREVRNGKVWYVQPTQVCLFGINQGFVPYLLRPLIQSGQGEPRAWHVDVRKQLAAVGHPTLKVDKDSSLVINLKPKNKQSVLNFFELLDVWGYTDFGWTPAMVHLREILSLPVTGGVKLEDYEFAMDEEKWATPIYSFWYFREGGIANGKLVGPWGTPSRSPTNSVLLWPPALEYFLKCLRAMGAGKW